MSDASGHLGAVVIGRNEGQRLIECLKSLQPEFQTIVYVDSGSSDGSVDKAHNLGVTVVSLDMSIPFTAARARNEGFAKLKSMLPNIEYVQFIDGDCELQTGWLEAALMLLQQQPGVAVVFGRRTERYPTQSIYNQIVDDEWNVSPGEVLSCGGDSLMRVNAFEQVEGFRAQFIAGEEPELCVRLRERGWKIWHIEQNMTKHDIAMSRFGQWWTRGIRSGYAITEVALLYWNSPFGIWKRETLSAIVWAGILPLVILIGSFIHPSFVLLLCLYPLQVLRLALQRRPKVRRPWLGSAFTVLDRFAFFQGLVVLFWRRLRGRSLKLIEYK